MISSVGKQSFRMLALVFSSLVLIKCESGVGAIDKKNVNIRMAWWSNLGCFEGEYLATYSGDILIENLSKGDPLQLYYGDSLAVDTIQLNDSAMKFMITQVGKQNLKVLKFISGPDTNIINSFDSMEVSHTLYGQQNIPLPINIRARFDTIEWAVSTLKDYPAARIKCGFDNTERKDTIKTLKKSGSIVLDLEADIYANEYEIFASVFDSNGIQHKAGEFTSKLGIEIGKKVALKRGQLHFETYLPYLPANITIPLYGGMGSYNIRIEEKGP